VPAALALALALGCVYPPRSRSDPEPDRGYPTCEGGLPEGERIAKRVLRAGPLMRERSVVEHFEIRRRGCVVVFSGRQAWSMSTTDLDVVYDAQTQLPLRVWKRTAMPAPRAPRMDTRRFELRGAQVTLAQRTITGELEHWRLRGPVPSAVIGPGRGLLTMWLRRVRLPVGGRVREHVLDARESMEIIREVTLRRLENRDDPVIGRRVRVYTIYGREPVYADDDDVVIGDMMGLVPAEHVLEPLPAPAIDPGSADPQAPL
jgi:hypothetical protein